MMLAKTHRGPFTVHQRNKKPLSSMSLQVVWAVVGKGLDGGPIRTLPPEAGWEGSIKESVDSCPQTGSGGGGEEGGVEAQLPILSSSIFSHNLYLNLSFSNPPTSCLESIPWCLFFSHTLMPLDPTRRVCSSSALKCIGRVVYLHQKQPDSAQGH